MKAWGERSADLLRSMLSRDGFHMGDRGYDCVAQLVANGLHSLVTVTHATPGVALTAAAHR